MISDSGYFRVVELNHAYDTHCTNGIGVIYCSNEIYDYVDALKYAIAHTKRTGLKTFINYIYRNKKGELKYLLSE